MLMFFGVAPKVLGARIPIRSFMASYPISQVRLSPTGRYLSVVAVDRKKHDRPMVEVLDLRALLKKHRVKILSTLWMNVGQFVYRSSWINGNRLIVEGALKVSGFDRPFADGKIWAVNANGNDRVYWSRDFFMQRILGHPRHALFERNEPTVPQYPEIVRRVNIYARHLSVPVMTAPLPRVLLLADPSGQVLLAYGERPLSGNLVLLWRKRHHLHWHSFSAFFKGQDPFLLLQGLGPVALSQHGQHFYALAETPDPRRTMGLYWVDPARGTERLLYANPKYDVSDISYFDGGSIILNRAGDRVVALRIMAARPHLVVLDPHSKKVQLMIAALHDFPHDFVSIPSMTTDGDMAVVKVWSDRDPGRYFLYEADPVPRLVYIFRADSLIPRKGLAKMEPIRFRSVGGVEIHGYLILPPGVPAHHLPLIVDVHGGPYDIRDTWGWHPTIQLFANRGYAVLLVNYRGSGGYGERFQALGYRHWGSTMQADIAKGVEWVVHRGIVDPKRICIYGGSYGGYAALMSAELYPTLYQCAVGYDGVYDLPMMETHATDIDRSPFGHHYLISVLGRNHKQLRAFSPVDQVSRLKIPVFLLQGGRDQRAPVAGYREMAAAIRDHGTPLETLYEPNEGHGFYRLRHQVLAFRKILAFFSRYIGPGARPPKN